jgi:hypothetical protein
VRDRTFDDLVGHRAHALGREFQIYVSQSFIR